MSYHIQESTQNVSYLNVRTEMINFLKQNIGVILCDLKLGKAFLDMAPKAQFIKENFGKLDFIGIKIFAFQKTPL